MMEIEVDDASAENLSTTDAEDDSLVSKRLLRKQSSQSAKQQCAKEERNATIKKVSTILQKAENERTSEDQVVLKACGEIVKEVQSRWKKRDKAKRRLEEFEEDIETLKQKCTILAQAIAQSQHLVVYTGAGISTAARIPDYRGTNGIWTMLQKGKDIGNHDLSLAEPTFTHMALSELYKRNILKYVVSQNCDGLHLRSGLPRTAISEVHGNMYIEVCKTCSPSREYWRLFDVTENTARFSHKTTRKCYICNGPLVDTIVHFGERGSLQWPLNWSGASKNARKATTIVCLGSSLKVLKKYPWLWQMHKPAKRRPNLYIVNLQWTPKDDCANVKIHGKCDLVMKTVMDLLGIEVPKYDRNKDPIFVHGTYLLEQECHTTTQPFLKHSEVPVRKIEDQDPLLPSESDDIKVVENGFKEEAEDLKVENCQFDEWKEPAAEVKHEFDVQEQAEVLPLQHEEAEAPVDEDMPLDCTKKDLIDDSNNEHCDSDSHEEEENLPLETQQEGSNNYMWASPFYGNFLTMEHLQNTFGDNCQALLTYYQLSQTILQNPLLSAYRDLLQYPFQTNLLYSGLHSIINPPSLANGEANGEEDSKKEEVPTCEYCYENYKSYTCLFYEKVEPRFVKQQFRFSKVDNCQKPLYCLCCDYTTEEEDEEATATDEAASPDKICKVQVDAESVEPKVKIQPGWYGKGYRKHKKQRKKLANT